MKKLFALFLFPLAAWATTYNSNGTVSDFNTGYASLTDGDTLTIAAGTWTWASAPSAITKAIKIRGFGGGRCEGSSATSLTVGTGSKSFTLDKGTNGSGQVLGPTVSANGFTVGETITANYKANGTDFMTGTVTSYDGTTLVLNITSTGGSGAFSAWTFTAPATTTIINNAGSSTIFAITESTVGSVEISAMCIQSGTGTGAQFTIAATSSGLPVLIHDVWSHDTASSARSRFLQTASNRGLVWYCYLDTGFTIGSGNHPGYGVAVVAPAITNSWTTASTIGTGDTTGKNNFYVENVYFAGCITESHDFSENSRAVLRYCIFDNSGGTSHGRDTGNWGQRHFEIYNNLYIATEMGASSAALTYWLFVRGGTFVITDNVIPACANSQYNGNAISLTAENLQRDAGVNPLWGWGNSSPAYPVPAQVGFGRITGTGTTSFTLGPGISTGQPAGYTVNGSTDASTYVGDSEPAHQWNNSGAGNYASPAITNYSTPNGAGNTVTGYIQVGRDYINGALSGYTKYQYPSPWRTGGVTSTGGSSLAGAITLSGNLKLN